LFLGLGLADLLYNAHVLAKHYHGQIPSFGKANVWVILYYLTFQPVVSWEVGLGFGLKEIELLFGHSINESGTTDI